MSIPKIIHLMWFGGGEFPSEIKKCIDSWKKKLPDYTIMQWNYEMAAQVNIAYVNEALAAKKWAFAADVMRLYALYTYGGVYMDADIFITDRFDQFMDEGVTFFQEYHSSYPIYEYIDENGHRIKDYVEGCGIQAAFFISEKGHPYVKALLDNYMDKHFSLDQSGKMKEGELIAPAIYALKLEEFGYRYLDVFQDLGSKVYIYPSKYVAGAPREVNVESFAIHQCSHSWADFTFFQKATSTVSG